jgi:hypothetical protein
MKRIMIMLCFTLLFFSTFPIPARAASKSTTVHSTILLKINQFYVVHTAPLAPYVDNNNRLMVPLRSMSDLLSAEVSYDAVNKVAMISRKNYLNAEEKYYTLKLTAGVNDIEINGVQSKMDTIPTLNKGSMFIPLSVITKALHIDTNFDQTKSLVNLKVDPAYLPSGVVSDELHFLSEKTNLNVRPISTSIVTKNNSSVPLTNVQLTLLNDASSTLSDKGYLHFYVQDSNFGYFDIHNKATTKPGATFSVQTTNTILSDSLRYILVVAYTD